MFANNTMILNNEMTTYKITPDFHVSNSKNEVITNSFVNLFETTMQRISFSNINLRKKNQIHFNIVLENRNASFYLSIPTRYNDLIYSKVNSCWGKCAIDKVDNVDHLKLNTVDTVGAEMVLGNYNVNAISTNLSDTSHLNSLFQLLRAVNNEEKIIINIAIEPINRLDWFSIIESENALIKEGKVKNVNSDFQNLVKKTVCNIGSDLLGLYLEYKLLPFELIFGMENDSGNSAFGIKSSNTKEDEFLRSHIKKGTPFKKNSEVFKCKLSILSMSKDNKKAYLNMLSVFESFKELNDDNELVLKELSHNKVIDLARNLKTYSVNVGKDCMLSTKEVAKLIQLPQKNIQKEFKIKALDSTDSSIPAKIKSGKSMIGIASSKGKEIPTYRSADLSYNCLPWIAVGSQTCGKTTLMKRIAYQNFLAGDSNLIIDTIEDCKIAKSMRSMIPDDRRVDIVVSIHNRDNIPTFSFNEVSCQIKDGMDSFERITYASNIAEQIQLIIESVSDDKNGSLTDAMIRYLYSASVVAFVKPNATLKDVFDILRNPDIRRKAVKYAMDLGCFDDDDVFFNLEQLDKPVDYKEPTGELDGKGKPITVTKTRIENNNQAIVGIVNRITTLEKVPYIKRMLGQQPRQEENFLKYIEEGKTIVVSIEQNEFPSKKIRDAIGLYYFSRVWLAVQSRKNNETAKPCHIFYDEVATIKTTINFIAGMVTEMRRHRLGLFTSCHTLAQFGNHLESFKSAGGSYILIQSTIKDTFELLKEEAEPYTLQDILSLKQYHALVIQRYEDGFAKYVCRLPDIKEVERLRKLNK